MRSLFFRAAVCATPAVAAPAADAQVMRLVVFQSQCSRPVAFIVHHSDVEGNWHPHAWYRLEPRQSFTFNADGILLRHLDSQRLYAYVQATDGSGVILPGNGPAVMYDERPYQTTLLRTSVDQQGNLVAIIPC